MRSTINSPCPFAGLRSAENLPPWTASRWSAAPWRGWRRPSDWTPSSATRDAVFVVDDNTTRIRWWRRRQRQQTRRLRRRPPARYISAAIRRWPQTAPLPACRRHHHRACDRDQANSRSSTGGQASSCRRPVRSAVPDIARSLQVTRLQWIPVKK